MKFQQACFEEPVLHYNRREEIQQMDDSLPALVPRVWHQLACWKPLHEPPYQDSLREKDQWISHPYQTILHLLGDLVDRPMGALDLLDTM